MKTLILFISSIFLLAFSYADVDTFEIEVDPSSPSVNKAADLTIRAVDADWNVVPDYDWDVLMILENWGMQDAEFPSDWIYGFKSEDQWEVVFTKWLTFRSSSEDTDEWVFNLTVEDMFDEEISWTTEVEVSARIHQEGENNTARITQTD